MKFRLSVGGAHRRDHASLIPGYSTKIPEQFKSLSGQRIDALLPHFHVLGADASFGNHSTPCQPRALKIRKSVSPASIKRGAIGIDFPKAVWPICSVRRHAPRMNSGNHIAPQQTKKSRAAARPVDARGKNDHQSAGVVKASRPVLPSPRSSSSASR